MFRFNSFRCHLTGQPQLLARNSLSTWPSRGSKVPRQADWWLLDWLGRDGGDPGHWNHVTEWVGGQGGLCSASFGKTIFSKQSEFNGLVEVTAHPCSDPGKRGASGEEWRVLRFNEVTRQSCARVRLGPNNMATARPDCLAQDYLQSMASITIGIRGVLMSSLPNPRVLFVGLGGGALPLFFSHHFPKWRLEAAEIDPIVWEAATQAMGFPEHLSNLHVHVEDIFYFLRCHKAQGGEPYDFIIVDAFNGENDSPDSLKGEEFAAALAPALHPDHGTVLLNLHSREGEGPAVYLKKYLAPPSQVFLCYSVGSLKQSNRTLVYARGLKDSLLTQTRIQEAAVAAADEARIPFSVKPRLTFQQTRH